MSNDCKYSLLAARNMQLLGIAPRAEILEDVKFELVLRNFIHDRQNFLRYLPCVNNINNASSRGTYDHILLFMIAEGEFYEEAMLRPELLAFRGDAYADVNYEDFYSAALDVAFEFRNVPAIVFLLKLNDTFYEGLPMLDDQSIDSECVPYETDHPPPIPTEVLNGLRALFLSQDIDQITIVIPNIYRFKFRNESGLEIAFNFKASFPVLDKLYNQLRRPADNTIMKRIKRSEY